MKANSGFGWDPTTGMPTAPDSVWDDLIAVYPQAKEFKSRPLFMYHELDIIMSRTAATGAFAVYDEHIISLARPAPSSLSGLSNDSGDEGSTDDRSAAEREACNVEQQYRSQNISGLNRNIDNDSGGSETTDRSRSSRRQSTDYVSIVGPSPKRLKTTGEKMSDSMRAMADAQKVIAASISTRHIKSRQLTCADEAIKIFKDMFTDEVPVHQRFRFIKLLATQPNAATMFYGMDDESRRYMVEQYLLTDNSDSD